METTRQCWGCCRWRRDRPTKEATRDTHTAPLSISPSATLLHAPSSLDSNSSSPLRCLLRSSAMTSAHRHAASLCTRESDACGCDESLRAMELQFSHHCQPPGGSAPFLLNLWASSPAPCTPVPSPKPCLFCSEGQTGPQTTQGWSTASAPGFLFVMAAVQHTFRAINNMYFDLAVHSS